jgi:BolA protein
MTLAEDRVARMRDALQRRFSPTKLEITDDSAAHVGHAGAREGGHFRVTLVSEAFRGHSSIERHRLVYAAVAELMGRDIHALNIVARTPEEIT